MIMWYMFGSFEVGDKKFGVGIIGYLKSCWNCFHNLD